MRFQFALGADEMKSGSNVSLQIIDVTGRREVAIPVAAVAGRQTVTWNGSDRTGRPAAPGLYWARLDVGQQRSIVKFVLVR
jgi:flagellar hook assembly protein FlgD